MLSRFAGLTTPELKTVKHFLNVDFTGSFGYQGECLGKCMLVEIERELRNRPDDTTHYDCSEMYEGSRKAEKELKALLAQSADSLRLIA